MRAHASSAGTFSTNTSWMFMGAHFPTSLFSLVFALCMVPCVAEATPTSTPEKVAFDACKASKPGVSVIAKVSAICISGRTTYQLQKDVRLALSPLNESDTEQKQIRYAVISGPGGEMGAAIEIAELLRDANLTAIVGEMCASSCAQFMFIGAPRKVILENGLVLFHGGPIPDSTIDVMAVPDAAKDSLKHEQDIFRQFYIDAGVDISILTSPPPNVAEQLESGKVVMWVWPVEKLREFGVANVRMVNK